MQSGIILRPFPSAPADLNLAMRADDPATVTAILSRGLRQPSGEDVPPDVLWALEIGERTAWLLRVAAGSGARRFIHRARCSAAPCNEPVEFELSVEDLLRLDHHDAPAMAVRLDDRTVRLRRPTGADQRAWTSVAFSDLRQAAFAVASSLMVDQDAPVTTDDELRALEDALAADDPLAHFIVSAACPVCGASTDHDIDLVALAMQWLNDARVAMIETVHALARAYHWTEADIFAIAPARRAHYLMLVERDQSVRQ